MSVIIPVYNGGAFIRTCFAAVLGSDFRSFEVIVVDDCSTDDSAELSMNLGANVLRMPQRSGPAAARNLAAKTAKGDILVFVDADVVIEPQTLGKFAEHFEGHPEIAAVFGSYDDEPAEKNFLSQYKNLQHHFVHQTSRSDASTFWSGLGAIRRDIFNELGGFDCEKFAVPSIEDIELGFRLRRAGHKILLDKNIQAKHLKRWEVGSHLRTEIFCRALPWSRLILENQGMINDMNLKTADRLSAALVGICILLLPVLFWKPILAFGIVACLTVIAFLNRKILTFYARKRGIMFAAMAFPWQLLYFFYSGVVFVICWIREFLSQVSGRKRRAEINGLC